MWSMISIQQASRVCAWRYMGDDVGSVRCQGAKNKPTTTINDVAQTRLLRCQRTFRGPRKVSRDSGCSNNG